MSKKSNDELKECWYFNLFPTRNISFREGINHSFEVRFQVCQMKETHYWFQV